VRGETRIGTASLRRVSVIGMAIVMAIAIPASCQHVMSQQPGADEHAWGHTEFRVESDGDSIQIVFRNKGPYWLSAFVIESGCPSGEAGEAAEPAYWLFDHVLDPAHPVVGPGSEVRFRYRFPRCGPLESSPAGEGIVAYAEERDGGPYGTWYLQGRLRIAEMIDNRRVWWRTYSWSLLTILNQWEPEDTEGGDLLSRFDRLFETQLVTFGNNNDRFPELERDPLRAQMIAKLRRHAARAAEQCVGQAARHCEAFNALKAEVTKIADRVRLAYPAYRSKLDWYWRTRDVPPPLFP
jgi:hypothetical protein